MVYVPTNETKIKTIVQASIPINVTQVKLFLGMVTYFLNLFIIALKYYILYTSY